MPSSDCRWDDQASLGEDRAREEDRPRTLCSPPSHRRMNEKEVLRKEEGKKERKTGRKVGRKARWMDIV